MKPEDLDSIKLFNWITNTAHIAPYCFHIANERKTSIRHGHKLKLMGVRSGASDYFIGVPRDKYHGMFLELKVGKNKPTKNQLDFMDDMSRAGYYCVWCTGFEAAKKCIEQYINKPDLIKESP